MRSLSPRLMYVLLLSFWWLLFGVKINLVAFGGSGARLDDVVFILSLPVLILAISEFSISRKFVLFCVFLLFSLLSLMLGAVHARISLLEGMFYWFRNIQYLTFFLIGLLLAGHMSMERVLRAYTLYLVVILTLQYLGLFPTFSMFVGSGRAVANTGGPYELAVIASFLAFFFWHQAPNRFYFLCSAVILVLTQSRITLFAFVIIMFALGLKARGRIVAIAGVLVLVLLFSFVELGVLDRFAELFNQKTLDTFTDLLSGIPTFSDTWDYRDWAFSSFLETLSVEGDTSAIIRFSRQVSLVHSTVACGAECVLFGLGPSFASSAVDGNIVRFFVEYGIVGTVLFLFGAYRVAKATGNRTVISYFFLLVITACAIDILVSSKAMSLFWFLCGFYSIKNEVFGERSVSDAIRRPDKARGGYSSGGELC